MTIWRLACICLLAAAGSQCAMPGRPGEERNMVYTPDGWPAPVLADFHRPAGGAPAPVVILIHGGGLKMQKDLRWQMRGIARRLAARGYFVMNVTYRNAPDWEFPAPVEDLMAAMDWIGNNAGAYGIDSSRIATFGYSAGGHLALLAGFWDERVGAIVAGAAPADLMLFEGGVLVGQSLGGSRGEHPGRYRAVSPVHQLHREAPPVFLYHGTRDRMIPPVHAAMMKSALDDAGVAGELHWIEGKGHVGAFLSSGEAVDRAIGFLDRVLR